VMESLRLITRAVSLGSVETLIQAPAQLTHRIVDPEDRALTGLSDDLLRLSVGLESVEDLWADLEQALNQPARQEILARSCSSSTHSGVSRRYSSIMATLR
jgi:methionine-gamma-lyase